MEFFTRSLADWAIELPDARQALRMRRFLLGSLSSLMVILALVYCLQIGLLTSRVFLTATSLVIGFNLLIFGLVRSGLNLKFADPSLTAPQIVAASATLFYVIYHAGSARAVFLIMVLMVFLFGVLRLRPRQLLSIALFDFLACVIVLFWLPEPIVGTGAQDIRVLLCIVMGASLIWFSMMAGVVADLRHNVEQRNRELSDALVSLKSRQADLSRVQKLAKLGVWSRELPENPVDWSGEAFHIFGVESSGGLKGTQEFRKFFHPDDLEIFDQYLKTSITMQESTEVTLRAIDMQDELRWIRIQGETLVDPQGAAIRQLGTVMDVSDSKRFQQRLLMQHAVTKVLANCATLEQAAPQLLRIVCQSHNWAAAAAWQVSPDNTHLQCIETWELDQPQFKQFSNSQRQHGIDLTGNQSGLLLDSWRTGLPNWMRNVSHDDGCNRRDAARLAGLRGAFVMPIIAGGKVLQLFEFYGLDTRLPDDGLIELSKSLGNQIGQFALRRNSEAELQLTQDKLANAIDAAGIGFWSEDLQTDACYYTDQIGNMLGYANSEMPKNRHHFVNLIHPDDRDRFLTTSAEGIGGGQVFFVEFRLRHFNGTHRWFVRRAKAERDDKGQPRRIAGSLVDIEDRKRLEVAKSEFVATVSHELITPLTSIRGAVSLLNGGVVGSLPADAKKLTAIALAGCDRLSELIAQSLAIAKHEKNPERQLETMAIDSAVKRVALLSQDDCDRKGVLLRTHFDAPGAHVKVGSQDISQLLRLLISNAVKFSPRGAQIGLTTQRFGSKVRISVVDCGIGIPVEFRARIFGKFEQADSTDSRQTEGPGLGLNLAMTLAVGMGGELDYFDTPGGGTTFHLDLPETAAGNT